MLKKSTSGKKTCLRNSELSQESTNNYNQFELIKCEESTSVLLNNQIYSTDSLDDQKNTLKNKKFNVNVKEEIDDYQNIESDMQYNTILIKDEFSDQYEDVAEFYQDVNETANEEKQKTITSRIGNKQLTGVDGFLLQLGEGMKRLPYKQRSILEIEYLKRLYEVQDNLGIFDT